jgi:hypothetical protein
MSLRWINHSIFLRWIVTISLIIATLLLIIHGSQLIISAKYPDKEFGLMYLGLIGGLVGILFTVQNYWTEQDKIQMHLVELFNEKYKNINGIILDIVNIDNKLASIDKKINSDAIQDYLNLCAEEYYWYKRGRLSSDIFRAWEYGMITNLVNLSMHTEIVNQIKDEMKLDFSYYGLFSHLIGIEEFHSAYLKT